VTIIVVDNAVTAMTGQQSHPGRDDRAGEGNGRKVDIESVLRGIGIDRIWHIDAFTNVKDNIKVLEEAIAVNGPSAVISHGECALYHFRNLRRAGGNATPYYVDREKCEKAHACIFNFMCPALSLDEEGYAQIDPALCVGCGVCSQLCPHNAIVSTATKKGGENRPYVTIEDYNELHGNGAGGGTTAGVKGGAAGGDDEGVDA
jgi:indolepyruvate ferredoxin oxidoreductase alpha subunit